MKAKLVQYFRMTAFRKGVVGTSSRWLGLWVGMTVAKKLRQRLGKEEVVVERITLRRGEAVEIRDTGIAREAFGEP